MRLIIKLLLLVYCCSTLITSSAQISGYMGKRFMVKTEISPSVFREPNLEVEYVINRRICFSASYERFNRTFNQDILVRQRSLITGEDFEEVLLSEYAPDLAEEILNGGTQKGNELNLRLKIFYKVGLPAPVGIYSIFNVGFAITEVKGIGIEGLNGIPTLNSGPFAGTTFSVIPTRYSIKQIHHTELGMGFGHQSVHRGRFVLDFGVLLIHRNMRYGPDILYELAQKPTEEMARLQFPITIGGILFSKNGFALFGFRSYLKLGVLIF